jgi:hypothetical protein
MRYKTRSEVIVTAAATTRGKELIIGPVLSVKILTVDPRMRYWKSNALLHVPFIGALDPLSRRMFYLPKPSVFEAKADLMMVRELCNLRDAPSE